MVINKLALGFCPLYGLCPNPKLIATVWVNVSPHTHHILINAGAPGIVPPLWIAIGYDRVQYLGAMSMGTGDRLVGCCRSSVFRDTARSEDSCGPIGIQITSVSEMDDDSVSAHPSDCHRRSVHSLVG